MSFDEGYVVGGAAGVILTPFVRVDIEGAYSAFDYGDDYQAQGFVGLGENGDMSMTTVTANVWFNDNWGKLHPYIGGGIGVGFVDADLTITNGVGAQFHGSDTGVALMGGAGVRYDLSPNMELNLGYRLRGVLDIGLDSSIFGFGMEDRDFVTHSIQGGLAVKF